MPIEKMLKQPVVRTVAKIVARQTLGRMPVSSSRLSGRLARSGGNPVRDERFRPWPRYHSSNTLDWFVRVGPTFMRLCLTGAEGRPQTLSQTFAREWADYCGARYGLLLPHGTDALRIALAAVLDHDGLGCGLN